MRPFLVVQGDLKVKGDVCKETVGNILVDMVLLGSGDCLIARYVSCHARLISPPSVYFVFSVFLSLSVFLSFFPS